MEYKFKAGQRVRILDVPSIGDRKEWVGREVTLKHHDRWDEPAWGVEEPDCCYRFRESEMAPPGPIRTETVTVRRIEPGVYGPLRVRYEVTVPDCECPDEPPEKAVEVSLVHMDLNAPELRELARVALEIAEYLDAQ